MYSKTYREIRNLFTIKTDDFNDPDGIRDYFLKIIEVMPNIVFWVDKDSIALGCNKNELDLLGLKSFDEFIGLNYEEIGALANWSKEQMAGFRKADQEVIATGKPKLNVLETPLTLKDNRTVQFLTSRVPLFDNQGGCIGVVGISIDITDQIKAKEVAEQLAVEKERSQVLEILGASIAHELRTPLASLRVANDAITQHLPNLMEFALRHADEYEKMFPSKAAEVKKLKKMQMLPEIMKNSIDSANFIINTLLMNINESHKAMENAAELSVKDVIDKALEQYPLTGRELSLIKSDNRTFICKGKGTLLMYAMFNLIRNSLYYINEAKKGVISIFTDTESDEKYNLLIFEDTAKGISPEVLPFIFDKFYSSRLGGTGLGLAFCKIALESFNGKITCESKEGEYTKFTLFFPKIENK